LIWPGWYSDRIIDFIVLENAASIVHFLFAVLVTLLGCHRRVFPVFAFYQFITTLAKTLAFPQHTLADWSWDFFGDVFEFLIGIGIVEAAGLAGRYKTGGFVERACSVKGILVGLAVLLVVWLFMFLRAYGSIG